MESGYIWLIAMQLLVIFIIFVVKYILYLVETNKIKKILDFIETRSREKDFKVKFQECIDIIEKCKEDIENE